jgi:hypothetical protein
MENRAYKTITAPWGTNLNIGGTCIYCGKDIRDEKRIDHEWELSLKLSRKDPKRWSKGLPILGFIVGFIFAILVNLALKAILKLGPADELWIVEASRSQKIMPFEIFVWIVCSILFIWLGYRLGKKLDIKPTLKSLVLFSECSECDLDNDIPLSEPIIPSLLNPYAVIAYYFCVIFFSVFGLVTVFSDPIGFLFISIAVMSTLIFLIYYFLKERKLNKFPLYVKKLTKKGLYLKTRKPVPAHKESLA